jgi:hypothetical protein
VNPSNLTSLASVKDWLGVTASTDDVKLTRLISAISAYVQQVMSIGIAVASYTHRSSGHEQSTIILEQFPVVGVASVMIDGESVPVASSPTASGYEWDEHGVYLRGWVFTKGARNVVIVYSAGYQETEVAVVPATPHKVKVDKRWIADGQVTNAAGLVLTKVTGVPTTGQYSVEQDSTATYTFAAADAGVVMTIVYSYAPRDLEQAVIELLGLRYREKDRIGHVSKAIGQETVAFSLKDMPDSVKTILNEYRKVMQ